MTGTLISAAPKSEGQVLKPLYAALVSAASRIKCAVVGYLDHNYNYVNYDV
jgi:hypothetical protein